MSYSDPAMAGSRFERRDGDRYWTHDWVTAALLETWRIPGCTVWEPAAGRGDMVRVLRDYGYDFFASDIDLGEYLGGDPCETIDFLTQTPAPETIESLNAIITNPPYNVAERFVRRAIEYMDWSKIDLVAMLLRSEFKHARSRRDLFGECKRYAGEVVLTTRPRWDWWYAEKPEASPRHNFSWFLWEKSAGVRSPVQEFHYRSRVKK